MQTAVATVTKPASRLASVKRGRIESGLRILVYGPESVGKTTLAASSPDPIFCDIESSSKELDVARYPFRDGADGHVPRTYEEVLAGLQDLLVSDHEYKTVVFDTVDQLEVLIWNHVIARDNMRTKGQKVMTSIEDYGYAKGYVVALDEWRVFLSLLDRLCARGMNILLIGHTAIRSFKNPEGDDYDRYTLRVHEKAAGAFKAWADVVAFATFEEGASKTAGQPRPRGWSTGRRVLKLERTAAFDAKSRIPMPAEVEVKIDNPWQPFADAIERAHGMKPAELHALIAAELNRVGDQELAANVSKAVEAAGTDTAALSRYLNNLKTREPKQEEKTNG